MLLRVLVEVLPTEKALQLRSLKPLPSMVTTRAASAAATKEENVVPPTIDSGFARRKIPIAAGLLGLTILYQTLIYLLQDSVRACEKLACCILRLHLLLSHPSTITSFRFCDHKHNNILYRRKQQFTTHNYDSFLSDDTRKHGFDRPMNFAKT